MKTKEKDFNYYLERGNAFFDKGNFLQAKRELELAKKADGNREAAAGINSRISICEAHIRKQRAQDLVKYGKAHLNKGKVNKALECFKQAFGIQPDNRLKEKIDELTYKAARKNLLSGAEAAEKAGDFSKAAGLYSEYLNNNFDLIITIRCALCFAREGSISSAVGILKKLPESFNYQSLDASELYDYGYVLAKAGRYYDCLKAWDCIESLDPGFISQKELVQKLLVSELYRMIENNDFKNIPETAEFLKSRVTDENLKSIADYACYAGIEQLWNEEKFEEIYKLLTPYPRQIRPALLSVYAKLLYKLSETSGKYLSELALFWLSSIYNPEVIQDSAEDDNICRLLAGKAESILNKRNEEQNRNVLACWNIESRVLNSIISIIGQMVSGARRAEPNHSLIQTPRFAGRFGDPGRILCLIKQNKDYFTNPEDYFTLGAYYTKAGEALIKAESGDYENIEIISISESDKCEFLRFGMAKAGFICGMNTLETKEKDVDRYFRLSAFLFEKAPRLEKELAAKAVEEEAPPKLMQYEKILHSILQKRQSRETKNALAHVIVKSSISMMNNEEISLDVFKARIQRALKLNPDDEYALSVFEEVCCAHEAEEMIDALSRHRLQKATEIALNAKDERVREKYFSYMKWLIKHIDENRYTKDEKYKILNDALRWSSQVDDTHPVLGEINTKLRSLS